ncbi:STAS/SEC14 domain-containing protein [Litorivivens sp.]|uniref:STAS/SEC14 domain-containing protein n=2 Tax=Litorivivens sp. TaxID=2020868 RepID=UPI0035657392
MFRVQPVGQDRIDIEMSGRLESNDMRAAIANLEMKCEHIRDGKMLYFVHDFEMPSAGAVGVELKQLPQLIRTLKHFDKAAVIADEKWIRNLSEVEGALFPGLEVKAFDMKDAHAAEAWLHH